MTCSIAQDQYALTVMTHSLCLLCAGLDCVWPVRSPGWSNLKPIHREVQGNLAQPDYTDEGIGWQLCQFWCV